MAARGDQEGTAPLPSGIYAVLHRHYGDLGWWPAEGSFEVVVGAILTQRTAWHNVELAMARLREAGVDGPEALLALPPGALEELVRPSGTYRRKARRLRDLLSVVVASPGGTLEAFLSRSKDELRRDLLSVKGIGPETADSIILYAAGLPVFVVDAYTRRVLGRLGVDAGGSYDDVARWFTRDLPEDAPLFNNFHATLVELAKDHCRKSPDCPACPLLAGCPTGRGSGHP